MSLAIVSAIFGGIDQKKDIPAQSVPFNEYHFTESDYLIDASSDRVRALYFKTQGHKVVNEDIILWIDGKVQILAYDFAEQCLAALGDNDIAIMKHHWRSCIYEEIDHIEHCIKEGNEYLATRYAHRPIRKEVELYRSMGYPAGRGLNDCCIIIRRNNERVNAMFDDWWDVCQRDYFDQVAIQFLAWANKIDIQPIIFKPGSYSDIPHIKMQ